MAAINPQPIIGNWRTGYALDLHTTSSVYIGDDAFGHPQFHNTYSELGRLLHRLKYDRDRTVVSEIVVTAAGFLAPRRKRLDLIIPVPPSKFRTIQPVIVIADGIGAAIGLPVISCVTTTRPVTQIKSIADPEKRKGAVAGLYTVDATQTVGKNVLLFDDLFRSGATLNAITDVLLRQGSAANVYVLTLTRTRSHR